MVSSLVTGGWYVKGCQHAISNPRTAYDSTELTEGMLTPQAFFTHRAFILSGRKRWILIVIIPQL